MSLEGFLLHSGIHRAGWALAHFVWQGAAVWLVVAGVLRMLRSSSAGVRYGVACAGLAAMAVLPAITFLALDDARVAVLTISQGDMPAGPQRVTHVARVAASHSERAEPASVAGGAAESSWTPASATVSAETSGPADWAEAPAGPVAATDERSSGWPARLESYVPWLFFLWAIGVFVLSVRLFGGWFKVETFKRSGAALRVEWVLERANAIAERLGIARPVRILESAAAEVPVAIGWLKPVVLLPACVLVDLPPSQLEAIIAHELAHVLRCDYVVNLFQTAIETLLFYHPCVWWLSRRIRVERENCCDDLAVLVCGDRVSYARALARLEEVRFGRGLIAPAADGGDLMDRIKRVVGGSPGVERRATGWLALPIVLALAVWAVMPVVSRAEAEKEGERPRVIEAGVSTYRQVLETAAPGDTILLSGGDYGEKVDIRGTGEAGSPVTVKAKAGATFGGAYISLSESRHVVIESFESTSVIASGSSDCAIRGCILSKARSRGIQVDRCLNMTIENCEISGAASHGIAMYGDSSGTTVRSSFIHDNGGSGIQVNPAEGGAAGVSGLVIEGNSIARNGASRGGAALNLADVSDSVIRNNLIYKNAKGGIVFYQDNPDGSNTQNKIVCNTVYFGPDAGFYCFKLMSGCKETYVHDNIFYGGSDGPVSVAEGNFEALDMDNNLIGNYEGRTLIGEKGPGDAEGYSYTLGFWKYQKGLDKNSLFQVDPKFVSVENDDYRLGPESPAIDAGLSLAPVCATDIEGTPRPQGAGFDAGCYESTGEALAAARAPGIGQQKMALSVVDKTSMAPVGGAAIKLQLAADVREAAADDKGVCVVEIPAGVNDFVEVTVSRDGYAPACLVWESPQGVRLPAQYSIRLPKAAAVGGTVETDEGRPVAGAVVLVSVPFSEGIERSAVQNLEAKTDDYGGWECTLVPEDATAVKVSVSHPDYVKEEGGPPSMESLRAKTAILRVRTKRRLAGSVVDEAGNPLRATVKFGERYDMYSAPSVVTTADGRFILDDVVTQSGNIVVTAAGRGPHAGVISVTPNMQPLRIVLEKAMTIRGRVVDGKGSPVADASVYVDNIGGVEPGYSTPLRTDRDGRFEWKEAPSTSVSLRADKGGYYDSYVNASPSDAEYVFTIMPEPIIRGSVVDAGTGAAVERFRITLGQQPNQSGRLEWETNAATEWSDGAYHLNAPFKQNWWGGVAARFIKVEARGYKTGVEEVQLGEESIVIDFSLEKSPSLIGTIKNADGTPAAGATVVIATPSAPPYLYNADASELEHGTVGAKVEADGKGEFWIPQQTETYELVVLADQGFAHVKDKDFEKSREITLSLFGRVEGDIPASPDGSKWHVSLDDPGVFDYRDREAVQWRYGSGVGQDARFAFDRVVPGTYRASRRTLKNLGGGRSRSENYDAVYIEVTAGETTRVPFDAPGRTVVGKIALPADAGEVDSESSGGWVQPAAPEDIVPADVRAKGEDEVQRYVDNWRRGKQAAPYIVGKRTLYARINQDGSFRIEKLTPGKYAWMIHLYLASGGTPSETFTFEVPAAGDEQTGPVDLGVVRLKASGPLKVGDSAVDFEIETVSGRTVNLAGYRGKHLVMLFWTADSRASKAAARALEGLRAQAEGKIEVLGLATDDAAAARKYAADNGIGFELASIGALEGSRIAGNYGVDGLPRAFLIGPDGVIVAVGTDGTRMADEARKAAGIPVIEAVPEPAAAAPAAVPGAQATPERGKAIPRDKYLVAVLDDCDTDFGVRDQYYDTLTIYDSEGNVLWQQGGFNTSQTIGGQHTLAYDCVVDSLHLVEKASGAIWRVDLRGAPVAAKRKFGGAALAGDPKTGNVWILSVYSLIYGANIFVRDTKGDKVAHYPIAAFDIAYSACDDCFWTVGKRAHKVGKDGKILWSSKEVDWCMTGVGVNPVDGSVWACEGRHPSVVNSRNRITIYASDGQARKEIAFDEGMGRPASVAIDASRGCAWVGAGSSLLKFSLDGELQKRVEITAFTVAVDDATGDVWAAGSEGVWKLDSSGKMVWMEATPAGSQKWVCIIPPRK